MAIINSVMILKELARNGFCPELIFNDFFGNLHFFENYLAFSTASFS